MDWTSIISKLLLMGPILNLGTITTLKLNTIYLYVRSQNLQAKPLFINAINIKVNL